jgi:hypothetical protein
MMIRATAFLLLCCGSAAADEIILKDGKVIAWTSITSKEDSYEIVTVGGGSLTVKKDQIAKIVAGPAKPEAPLTGASFTFKKTRPINLLQLIDVKTDGMSEGWTMTGGALVANGNYMRMTKLQISKMKDIPQDYDLTVTVERPDDRTTDFTIVLPGFTGKPFGVSFDANVGLASGIMAIEGKGAADGPAKVAGVFLKKGASKTITIMVRQEAVIVMVDGKDFLAWKAEWDKISLPAANALGDEKAIGFMLHHYGSYKISRIVLTTGPK